MLERNPVRAEVVSKGGNSSSGPARSVFPFSRRRRLLVFRFSFFPSKTDDVERGFFEARKHCSASASVHRQTELYSTVLVPV